MKIKINCKLLSEQINLCDACAEYFQTEYLKGLFDGIANLLSEINFALEEDEEIEFEKEEEDV